MNFRAIDYRKIILAALLTIATILAGGYAGIRFFKSNTVFYPLALSIGVFSFLIYWINKNTRSISFHLNSQEMILSENKTYKYSTISNYALYHLVFKKWGTLLRLKVNKRNKYIYLFPLNNNQNSSEFKQSNYNELNKELEKKMKSNSSKLVIDYIILFFVSFPLFILPFSLLIIIYIILNQ